MTVPQIRCLTLADFDDARALYVDLVGDLPVAETQAAFRAVIEHPGTKLWGAVVEGRVVSMATLHVLPNMTFSGRPYALVENVVTLTPYQGRGLGRAVMEQLAEDAWSHGVYKIMLLTGKTFGAKGFYERLGYASDQKHGMILRRAPQRRPAHGENTKP